METSKSKTPARTYGESVVDKIAAKYVAGKLAETIAENGIDWDEDATEGKSPGHKAVMLDAGNLLHLKMIFADNFPHRESVLAALLPPMFDTGKYDEAGTEGKDGDEARKMARNTIRMSVRLLDEMLRVYTHELSHKAAGEHFGAEGEVAVIVMPEMQQVGELGYGICMNLTGGRCRFDGTELTPEQRAVINVAGHMGEKLCTSVKSMGEDPSRDVDYWLRIFTNIRDAGDPQKAKDRSKTIYHNGAYDDAMDFFKCAPTEEEQRAAIATAGEVIIKEWADILASAAYRSIRHLTTLGDVMGLMTTAMELAESAACGTYGEVRVMSMNKPEEAE
jgi:hypothetical protein